MSRSLQRYLEHILKLQINQEKSKVAPTDQIRQLTRNNPPEQACFVGAASSRDPTHVVAGSRSYRDGDLGGLFLVSCLNFLGAKIRWSEKDFAELKRRVKLLTGRSWFVSMDYRLQKLAEYLRGWMGCFGIAEYHRPIPEIDQWLRRRVRMCYWKRWRRPRTKVRELLKMGTSLSAAIPVALSRKGPWHLARTLATQTGMTNRWLQTQGLLSVKELWVKIHYPATAR